MAKRLINKSRVARLSSYPWADGVGSKDLPKANPEELRLAVHAIRPTWHDLGEDRFKEMERQYHLLLEKYLTTCETYEVPPKHEGEYFGFTLTSSEADTIFPKAKSRLEQLDALKSAHPTVTNAWYEILDEIFTVEVSKVVRLPFLEPLGEVKDMIWCGYAESSLRVIRLGEYPWQKDVETHDLLEASVEELRLAEEHLEEVGYSNGAYLSIAIHDQLTKIQARRRLLSAPAEQTVVQHTIPKQYEYMMEATALDDLYPDKSRDEQAAEVEKADHDVLACVWSRDHLCFLMWSFILKTFPFESIVLNAQEDQRERNVSANQQT